MLTLRHALRSLARSRVFVVVSVLALGLGLGLSTTMFAVLDSVRHPRSVYHEPERLFDINWWFGRRNPMRSAELYRFIRDNARSFEAVVPIAWQRGEVSLGDDIQDVGGVRVPPRWFAATGIRLQAGRAFTAADGPDVAILSDTLWLRFFGSRRFRAGATLQLDGRVVTIVGTVPRGEGFLVLAPLGAAIEEQGGSNEPFVRPQVRLRPGVSREQAADELRSLAGILTARFDAHEAPFALELVPVAREREEIRDIHRAMVGSALVVLVIACVNLAHLMLARGLARRRDLALRLALGASRARVVGEMFAECALITLGGAALGALLSVWGTYLLRSRMPASVAWIGILQPYLSWRVFALAALLAAASAVVFGVLPAIRVALDISLDEPLKDGAGTSTGRVRHRYNPLVVSEVALALVLLMGGALLLRTVHQLRQSEPGVDMERLLSVYLRWRRPADSTALPPERGTAIAQAVASVRGVRDVATITTFDLPGFAITPEQSDDSARLIMARSVRVVSASYLRVFGLPVVEGRDFEPGDELGSGVAVVDAIAARRLYPAGDAVGRTIKLGGLHKDVRWFPIVGIARSPYVLESAERHAPQPTVLVAMRRERPVIELLIRSETTDPAIAACIRARLRQDPQVAGYFMIPYDQARQSEIASRAFLARTFVTMGVMALALAALGMYGVLAYAVSRRMREFAVRVALGAEPSALYRMVLHDGTVMVLAGIGVGAFAALAAARYLDAVLYAILPSDVVSLVASEALLLAVGLAAALAPARRAARADPLAILRAI